MSDLTPDDILGSIDEEYEEDIDEEQVEEEIESYASFNLPKGEVRNGVLSKLAQSLGISTDELTGSDGSGGEYTDAPEVDIASITDPEEQVTISAEVAQLWEPKSDKIAQVGLLNDGTDRIKFVSWDDADKMMVTEGEQYQFSNVTTSEYDGRMSVNVNQYSEIDFLEDEIDVSSGAEFEGAFVALQNGSGLIKRCPEEDCSRTLKNGDRCSEHGSVEYEDDLRVKGVLDDGDQTFTIIINDLDTIEELTGYTLESALDEAEEKIDRDAVAESMEPMLLGTYFNVTAQRIGDFYNVEEIEKTVKRPDTDSLLVKARSI